MEEQKIRYYEFGEFRLDAKRRILFKNGEQIPLTGRNFDLLLVMLQSDGRILEHEELLEKVWGDTFVEQANLKKGISSLRQTLGEKPNESLYIKTIPRRGYSFVAEVLKSEDDSGFYNAGELVLKDAPPTVIAGNERPERFVLARETSEEFEIVEIEEDAPELPAAAAPAPRFFSKYKIPMLAAASLLVVAAAFFGIRYFRQTSVSAENFRLENLKIQKVTTGGNVIEAAISPDGKTMVYATVGDNKQQTLWAKRAGAASGLQIVPPSRTDYRAITVSPDNNYVFYAAAVDDSPDALYKIPLLGGNPRKLAENISSAVTFSPDDNRIAFLRDPDNLSRVLISANAENGDDEREIHRVNDNHQMINPIWSPDGKKIAFVSSRSTEKGRIWAIVEIPAEGGEPREIVASRKGKIYIFDWSRDGKGLIVCADPNDSQQSQLWYAAYPSGEMSRLTNDILIYQSASLSADGNSILTIQKERAGDLFEMNYPLLQNAERLTDSQTFMGRFAVAPDNRILAETNENGRRSLAYVNAEGKSLQPLFSQPSNEAGPSISPDGKTIYFTSTRSGTAEIWQADGDGRNAKQLTDEKTFVIMPKLAPDGKHIYFGIYDAIRWRLARIPATGGKAEFVLEETSGAFNFSPDGNFLAYSFYDAANKRWKIAVKNLSENTKVKEFEAAAFDFVGWTPDGKNLTYTLPEFPLEGGNLWLQPLDGSPSKLISNPKDDKILWAAQSNDGQKIYFTKGKAVSNLVLISRETTK